ncbi:MAG: hypothetical protein K2N07_02045, partial [Desulfovibrio sp.]|nr:hypothetical protein [Desulfovibrio sp.]
SPARHMGLRVLGISCLTNKNLPDCMAPAPLAEVIEVAGRAGEALGRLLMEVLSGLAEATARGRADQEPRRR